MSDSIWFDCQDEATCRFWLDRASELFRLPDSATPRQCWTAFLLFGTRGVLAPQLLTHAAVIRKHGQPLFTVHCPPGMLHLGNVVPFWSETAFKGYLADLRAQCYLITFDAPAAAFVRFPCSAIAASIDIWALKACPRCGGPLSVAFEPYCFDAACLWNNEESMSKGAQ